MRLRQIIKESTDLDQLYDTFMISKGTASETPDGINLSHGLEVRMGSIIKSFPVQLNIVKGTVFCPDVGLTNLKNFPRKVDAVTLDRNQTLTSLATDYPVELNGKLSAVWTGITDLTGFKFRGLRYLILSNCHSLTSLDGTSEKIEVVNVAGCPKLTVDLTKYKNIKRIITDIRPDRPNMKYLLDPRIEFDVSGRPDDQVSVWRIIQKYQGKVPQNILNIMRELRDAGFSEYARI